MDDLSLNVFTNKRKSRISKKQFYQVPLRDSQKKLFQSSKKVQSVISISKTIDEPKHSDAFKNSMKGVTQIGKRIQDKYSNKNLQSIKEIYSREDQRWRGKIDKINQQKMQEDLTINLKQQIGVGTSNKNLIQINTPIKIYSPEGSRIVPCTDGSKIIFPPQIVQTRPLSMPKPIRINHIIEPITNNSRIIYINQNLPKNVVISQPIIRKTIPEPIKIFYPQIRQQPDVYYYTSNHNLNSMNFQNCPNFNHLNQPLHQIHPNPPQMHRIQMPINYYDKYSNMQPTLNPILKNTCPQPQQLFTQNNNIHSNNSQYQQVTKEKQNKLVSNPQKQNSLPTQQNLKLSSITPEQYQIMLSQQYQNYNSQNQQLLQYLSQLTEQQKTKRQNQKLFQQFLKNNKNNQVIKMIINQQIKKVKKVVEKKIINQQNIKNVQNVRNQSNIVNNLNQINYMNVLNMKNAQNIQNLNNQQNILMIQSLKKKQINPQITSKRISINSPLQPINDNRIIPSKIQISSKSIEPSLKSQKAVTNYQKIVSVWSQFDNKKIEQKIFNQILEQKMNHLNIYNQHIYVNNQINDLTQLQKNNVREGMIYLRKMDAILDKHGRIINKLQKSSANQSQKIKPIPQSIDPINNYLRKNLKQSVNQSTIYNYMPIVHESQPQQPSIIEYETKTSPQNKHFLSLTKNTVFDFISSFSK